MPYRDKIFWWRNCVALIGVAVLLSLILTDNTYAEGQTPADASRVQARMKELGYYRMKVDGDWGRGSKVALRAFKAANQLPCNWVWDQQTEAKLFSADTTPCEQGTSDAGLAESYIDKGHALLRAERDEDAAEAFRQAIRIKPDFQAYLFLGGTYLDLGRYEDAAEAFKQAIRINPNNAHTHYLLGKAYTGLKRHADAVEAHKQAIRIDPDDLLAHNGLGEAYEALGGRKPFPNEDTARKNFWKECSENAVEAFKQVIRINPDYAKAHLELGNTYMNLGRNTEAIEAHRQAIRISPDYVDAHLGVGNAYYNLGRLTDAIEAYKQAIRIKPDDVGTHYILGLTHIWNGDKGSALDEYKILKELDKEYANKLFNEIYK